MKPADIKYKQSVIDSGPSVIGPGASVILSAAKNLLLAAIVILTVSCNPRELEDSGLSDEEIALSASALETKAVITQSSLETDGTSLKVFDYLEGFSGMTPGHSGTEFFYIENQALTYSSSATWHWVFGNPASPTNYRWTRTGTHNFFGWLQNDATASGLNTDDRLAPSWNNATMTLNVSNIINIDSPQYDFLYSDVVSVSAGDGIPSYVPLPMHHLFGALGITVTNTSETDVVVYGVRLLNFPNMGSAIIDFSDFDNGVGINYNYVQLDPSYDPFWPNKIQTPFTLYNRNHANAGKVYDAYTGTEIGAGDPTFLLSWPMAYSALVPTVSGYDDDGNEIYTSSSPLIEVDYGQVNGPHNWLSFRYPAVADPSESFIAPGKKSRLNLNFADKQVVLTFNQLPWDYEDFSMAFEGDAISSTQLKFKEGTYLAGDRITDENGRHDVIQLIQNSSAGPGIAKGSFKIYTPVNAYLTVNLSGDFNDFIVTLDSGDVPSGPGGAGSSETITINPMRDGGLVTLTVRPSGTATSGSRVFLHFSVRNAGRDTDADTEINRDSYAIVIP